MDDTKISLIIGLIMIGIVLGIFVITGGITYLIENYLYCPNFGEEAEKEVKYNFWAGGCFVQLDNGQWIRSNKYFGGSLEE